MRQLLCTVSPAVVLCSCCVLTGTVELCHCCCLAASHARRRCADTAAEAGLPLVGNGDVFSYSEWAARLATPGVATAMIGRAALIKPWIFTGVRVSWVYVHAAVHTWITRQAIQGMHACPRPASPASCIWSYLGSASAKHLAFCACSSFCMLHAC